MHMMKLTNAFSRDILVVKTLLMPISKANLKAPWFSKGFFNESQPLLAIYFSRFGFIGIVIYF